MYCRWTFKKSSSYSCEVGMDTATVPHSRKESKIGRLTRFLLLAFAIFGLYQTVSSRTDRISTFGVVSSLVDLAFLQHDLWVFR